MVRGVLLITADRVKVAGPPVWFHSNCLWRRKSLARPQNTAAAVMAALRRDAFLTTQPCPMLLQDFLCGIRGKDFVMVCSDTSAVQSIVTMKQDEDKLVPVDSHKLFAISGEAGDRVNFSEYIIANVRLYSLRNGSQLSTKAVANFTRSELATALRKVG
jgi:20S proteasome subunit beta 4